jgi:hypothetical protein
MAEKGLDPNALQAHGVLLQGGCGIRSYAVKYPFNACT